MPRSQPELKLHQRAYTFFHNTYPDLRKNMWHTQNEGKRSKYERSYIKSVGLTKGVADLMFFYGGQLYGLELKTPNGRQSAPQKKWQAAIEKQGGEYHIIRTLEDFKSLIKTIIK